MFKWWWNHKLSFSTSSYASIEQDKSLHVWVLFIFTIGYLYCQTSDAIWIDDHLVSEGALASIENNFYDSLKDQGCIKNDKDKPKYDVFV